MNFLQVAIWLSFYISCTAALPTRTLIPRAHPTIINNTGTIEVRDMETKQLIQQWEATNGSGHNFSPPAVIWIVFCLTIGTPMALTGIRLERLASGIGCGLALTVCAWVALVNSLPEIIGDLRITFVSLGLFVVAFLFGLFQFTRVAGIALIGVLGGIAFGVRCVLLRESGLLLDYQKHYVINWVIPVVSGIVGVAGIIIWRRWSMLVGTASIGSFFIFLGVDLILHKQDGMSRGLRMLFDRNPHHFVDIITNSYRPQLLTRVLISTSIGAIPLFALFQHLIFSSWKRSRPVSETESHLTEPKRFASYFGEPSPSGDEDKNDTSGPQSRFSL